MMKEAQLSKAYLYMNSLTPSADQRIDSWNEPVYNDEIEGIVRYPQDSANIPIHDPRAFRSMSRSAILLSNVCLELGPVLEPYLSVSPFSVGLYCAVENGPMDAESTAAIVNAPPDKFAEVYKKNRNAKMYLKQLPNVVSAQLSIFLNLQGPLTTYTNPTFGVRHAIDDAVADLRAGIVNAAVVCSSHGFDDFLITKRARSEDSRPLAEGAAVLVMGKEGIECDAELFHGENARLSRHPQLQTDERYYGIADELISLVKRLQ